MDNSQLLFDLQLQYRMGHLAEVSRDLLDGIVHRQRVVIEKSLREHRATRPLLTFWNGLTLDPRVEHHQEYVSLTTWADPGHDAEAFTVHYLAHLWRSLHAHHPEVLADAFQSLHFRVIASGTSDPDAIKGFFTCYAIHDGQLVRFMGGEDFELVTGARGPLPTAMFKDDWLARVRHKARARHCDCPICPGVWS